MGQWHGSSCLLRIFGIFSKERKSMMDCWRIFLVLSLQTPPTVSSGNELLFL